MFLSSMLSPQALEPWHAKRRLTTPRATALGQGVQRHRDRDASYRLGAVKALKPLPNFRYDASGRSVVERKDAPCHKVTMERLMGARCAPGMPDQVASINET